MLDRWLPFGIRPGTEEMRNKRSSADSLLPHLVPASVAADGRFIHAERATRVGLVPEVVSDAGLEDWRAIYMREMLKTSPKRP
jgi:hypothetical protein